MVAVVAAAGSRTSGRARKAPELFVPTPRKKSVTREADTDSSNEEDEEEESIDDDDDESFVPPTPAKKSSTAASKRKSSVKKKAPTSALRRRVGAPTPSTASKRRASTSSRNSSSMRRELDDHDDGASHTTNTTANTEPTDELNALFRALRVKTAKVDRVARAWMQRFRTSTDNGVAALSELVGLVCLAGGYPDSLTTLRYPRKRLTPEHAQAMALRVCETMAAELSDRQADAYPLQSRVADKKHFAKSYSIFWRALVQYGTKSFLLAEESGGARILIWLTACAGTARLKGLRHAGMVAGLELGAALISHANDTHGVLDKAKRQAKAEERKCVARMDKNNRKQYESARQTLEDAYAAKAMADSDRDITPTSLSEIEDDLRLAERAWGRVQGLTPKARSLVDTCHSKEQEIVAVDSLLVNVFKTIFKKRSRDVSVTVRLAALSCILVWMRDYPALMVKDEYTRNIAWMLNDADASVRAAALSGLDMLVTQRPEVVEQLRSLLDKFLPRIVEMLCDSSAVVSRAVLDLMRVLLPHSILDGDSIFAAEDCLFISDIDAPMSERLAGATDGTAAAAAHHWAGVRQSAAKFVLVSCDNMHVTVEKPTGMDGMSSTTGGNEEDDDEDEEDAPGYVKILGLASFMLQHALCESSSQVEENYVSKAPSSVRTEAEWMARVETKKVVDTVLAVPGGDFLCDWAGALTVLAYDATGKADPLLASRLPKGLDDSEARVVSELLKCAVEHILPLAKQATLPGGKRINKADKMRADQALKEFTPAVLDKLPAVLTKFQNDSVISANLCSVLVQLDLSSEDVVTKARLSALRNLTKQLCSVYQQSVEEETLVQVASALAHMCTSSNVNQNSVQDSVSALYVAVQKRCKEALATDAVDLVMLDPEEEEASVSGKKPSRADLTQLKDREYALCSALRRLNVLERVLPYSARVLDEDEEMDVDEGNNVALVAVQAVERRVRAGAMIALGNAAPLSSSQPSSAKKRGRRSATHHNASELLNADVVNEALGLGMSSLSWRTAKVLQITGRKGALASDVQEEAKRLGVFKLRDTLVYALQVTLAGSTHRPQPRARDDSDDDEDDGAGYSTDTSQAPWATGKRGEWYRQSIGKAAAHVVHDIRLLLTPRLQLEKTAARSLAWTPNREMQRMMGMQLQGDMSKMLSTSLVEQSDDTSIELDGGVKRLRQVLFQTAGIMPWARETLSADAGDEPTLKATAALLGYLGLFPGQPINEVIRQLNTHAKHRNPKRCLELHMTTLLMGYRGAMKNADTNEGEARWSQTCKLSENLAKSLGVVSASAAGQQLAAAVGTALKKGIAYALKDAPHSFGFLELLVAYLKHGGFARGKVGAGLQDTWRMMVANLPDDVKEEIEEARLSEVQQRTDSMDAFLAFEGGLFKRGRAGAGGNNAAQAVTGSTVKKRKSVAVSRKKTNLPNTRKLILQKKKKNTAGMSAAARKRALEAEEESEDSTSEKEEEEEEQEQGSDNAPTPAKRSRHSTRDSDDSDDFVSEKTNTKQSRSSASIAPPSSRASVASSITSALVPRKPKSQNAPASATASSSGHSGLKKRRTTGLSARNESNLSDASTIVGVTPGASESGIERAQKNRHARLARAMRDDSDADSDSDNSEEENDKRGESTRGTTPVRTKNKGANANVDADSNNNSRGSTIIREVAADSPGLATLKRKANLNVFESDSDDIETTHKQRRTSLKKGAGSRDEQEEDEDDDDDMFNEDLGMSTPLPAVRSKKVTSGRKKSEKKEKKKVEVVEKEDQGSDSDSSVDMPAFGAGRRR